MAKHGIRFFLLLSLLASAVSAARTIAPPAAPDLESRIGQMLLVGFRGTEVRAGAFIDRAIKEYSLGGVILFDVDVPTGSRPRNIVDPAQVRSLIQSLQAAATIPLLVAVDAEGGRVNRLRPEDGFLNIPGARDMAGRSRADAEKIYRNLAGQLASLGFNCNLAPVVDLDLNPRNPVIGALDRSYSSDPERVIDLARLVVKTHRRAGVITCLKHYPGHGSSKDDSHLGLVDITKTWQSEESLPYRALIGEGLADMIMTAHIIHRGVDPDYPATLSPAHLKTGLRNRLGYQGVIISDDIQMGAVTGHFGEAEAAVRAVRAGCDILSLANNGRSYDEGAIGRVFRALVRAVKDGSIPRERIERSFSRILRLKRRYGIIKEFSIGADAETATAGLAAAAIWYKKPE